MGTGTARESIGSKQSSPTACLPCSAKLELQLPLQTASTIIGWSRRPSTTPRVVAHDRRARSIRSPAYPVVCLHSPPAPFPPCQRPLQLPCDKTPCKRIPRRRQLPCSFWPRDTCLDARLEQLPTPADCVGGERTQRPDVSGSRDHGAESTGLVPRPGPAPTTRLRHQPWRSLRYVRSPRPLALANVFAQQEPLLRYVPREIPRPLQLTRDQLSGQGYAPVPELYTGLWANVCILVQRIDKMRLIPGLGQPRPARYI